MKYASKKHHDVVFFCIIAFCYQTAVYMINRNNSIILNVMFLICLVFLFPNNIMADSDSKENIDKEVEEKFNAGELIFDHILDTYDWHILTWKG